MMFSRFIEETLTRSSLEGGCGMSTRPAFYSGRGATSADLSSSKLERLYKTIVHNVNKDAGESFVKMVAAIPKLTATDFLLALHRLEQNDWKWNKKLLESAKGLYAESMADGFATVISVVGGRDLPDETVSIRWEFLRDHDTEEPRRPTYNNPYGLWPTAQ